MVVWGTELIQLLLPQPLTIVVHFGDQLPWVKQYLLAKSDVTFRIIDCLPKFLQVGLQNPTEWELAKHRCVGIFCH